MRSPHWPRTFVLTSASRRLCVLSRSLSMPSRWRASSLLSAPNFRSRSVSSSRTSSPTCSDLVGDAVARRRELLVDEGLLAVELGARPGPVAFEERAVELLHLVHRGLDGRVAALLAGPALLVGEPAHLAGERRVAGATREQRPADEPARAADDQRRPRATWGSSAISRLVHHSGHRDRRGTTLTLMVGSASPVCRRQAGDRVEAQRTGHEAAQRAAAVLLVPGDGGVERRRPRRGHGRPSRCSQRRRHARIALQDRRSLHGRREPPGETLERVRRGDRRSRPARRSSSAIQRANAVSTCSTIGFGGPPAASIGAARARRRARNGCRARPGPRANCVRRRCGRSRGGGGYSARASRLRRSPAPRTRRALAARRES